LKTIYFILITLLSNQIFCQDIFLEDINNSQKKNEVVAELGNLKITAEEFIYSYEFGPAFPKKQKDSKLTHLNYMINEKLLALEGFETGVLEKEFPGDIYKDIESDLAAEEMFQKEIAPKVVIDDYEIEKVIDKKQTEYQIRWLYTDDLQNLENYVKYLKTGISFDSLFSSQLNDSVLFNDRQLTSSLYNIYMKNPQFAQIIDTLNPGKISDPIHTDDGWYIIKIDNILKNMITSETEYEKLKSESLTAITKSKLDILSDEYVKDLFISKNPTIKRDTFNLLRSYLGKFVLTSEKYSEWELDNKLDVALNNLGLKRGEEYRGLTLVEYKSNNVSLDEFIIWYRVREQYVKFVKDDLIGFSKSLENLVWLMVRDKFITDQAYQKGYNKSDWVVKQTGWWKDKICYSAYRNELAGSITLNSEEIKLADEKSKTETELLSEKLSKKILYKVLELKKKYKVTVNEKVLDNIIVSSENEKKAIDMYIVKRGNLIPRPAFPTIDNDWASWE
jgi:hypothetical protein